MKEVFMPSMDELYQMQDRGADVYKYILVKAIESIICCGLNYPSKGMFMNAYKYLRENPEIAKAVCSLYPDEIIYSESARNDVDLAIKLMDFKGYQDSGLDYLCRFDNSVLTNTHVLTNIILKLEKELANNPSYRFEYMSYELAYLKKGSGRILDKIFNCQITESDLMLMLNSAKTLIIKALANIEPAYALRLNDSVLNEDSVRNELLRNGVNSYAQRYGIWSVTGYEYYGKDILTNPDTNVKRLIKCINDRNK